MRAPARPGPLVTAIASISGSVTPASASASIQRRAQRLEVRARRDLGDDAAVAGVLLHRGGDRVGEQLGAAHDADARSRRSWSRCRARAARWSLMRAPFAASGCSASSTARRSRPCSSRLRTAIRSNPSAAYSACALSLSARTSRKSSSAPRRRASLMSASISDAAEPLPPRARRDRDGLDVALPGAERREQAGVAVDRAVVGDRDQVVGVVAGELRAPCSRTTTRRREDRVLERHRARRGRRRLRAAAASVMRSPASGAGHRDVGGAQVERLARGRSGVRPRAGAAATQAEGCGADLRGVDAVEAGVTLARRFRGPRGGRGAGRLRHRAVGRRRSSRRPRGGARR